MQNKQDFFQQRKIKQRSIDVTIIKCCQQNQALLFCLNDQCVQKPSFTCNNFKCKCNLIHRKCQKGIIQTTLDMIIDKNNKTLGLKQYIDQVIQKQILRLSQLRQNLLHLIQDNLWFINLTQIESLFYKIFINQQRLDTFTGQSLSRLWKTVTNEKINKLSDLDQIKESIKSFSSSIMTSSSTLIQKIQSIILKKCQQKHQNNVDQTKIKTLIQDSSIIDTRQNYNKLTNLFDRKIRSLNLLYKASSNNFSMQKYYQSCGYESQTITICLNNKDKIIGGYTPLQLNPNPFQKSNHHLADYTNTSFVFSLTTNEKFKLKRTQQAIYRYAKKDLISFGGYFYIGNEANKRSNSAIDFDSQVYDSLQHKNNKDSNLKIIGHQNHDFSIQEWEVIKVQFQE